MSQYPSQDPPVITLATVTSNDPRIAASANTVPADDIQIWPPDDIQIWPPPSGPSYEQRLMCLEHAVHCLIALLTEEQQKAFRTLFVLEKERGEHIEKASSETLIVMGESPGKIERDERASFAGLSNAFRASLDGEGKSGE